MDAAELLSLAKRRGFLWPAYEIYGGVAGLYDYGPLGAAMKVNLESYWRELYVLGEGFAEISSPILAPEEVFRASGHLDAFEDYLVECAQCGEAHRADQLAAGLHANPDSLEADELSALLRQHAVRCPQCGGELGPLRTFNLMFGTHLGAGKGRTGYLRPETAQGIFVDFALLLRHFRDQLPFGVVQIGRSMRNEISPRQGVLRLREFNMLEAELFIHPEHKEWPKFAAIAEQRLTFVPAGGTPIELPVGEAVRKGIVLHETLGYFLWLTQKYLVDVGVDPRRLRFRQHAKTEMAHYATDTWDCEAALSTGWVELVGIADRGCYDVTAHISHSAADLTVFERFPEPRETVRVVVRPKFELLGPAFKERAKAVAEALSALPPESAKDPAGVSVRLNDEPVSVPRKFYELAEVRERAAGRKIVPHVVEPSYGLDRILYALLEHTYTSEGERVWLRLPARVAPILLGVFPLMPKDHLDVEAQAIHASLLRAGLSALYDDGGSIGRRYARADEIGVPWCVTVDYTTLEDRTVTIRDRETAAQVRVAIDDLISAVQQLRSGVALSALPAARPGAA